MRRVLGKKKKTQVEYAELANGQKSGIDTEEKTGFRGRTLVSKTYRMRVVETPFELRAGTVPGVMDLRALSLFPRGFSINSGVQES